jgi:hypothetical protein
MVHDFGYPASMLCPRNVRPTGFQGTWRPRSARFILNITSMLLARPSCRALYITREGGAAAHLSRLNGHCHDQDRLKLEEHASRAMLEEALRRFPTRLIKVDYHELRWSNATWGRIASHAHQSTPLDDHTSRFRPPRARRTGGVLGRLGSAKAHLARKIRAYHHSGGRYTKVAAYGPDQVDPPQGGQESTWDRFVRWFDAYSVILLPILLFLCIAIGCAGWLVLVSYEL